MSVIKPSADWMVPVPLKPASDGRTINARAIP